MDRQKDILIETFKYDRVPLSEVRGKFDES
jgi:hypothetical protein